MAWQCPICKQWVCDTLVVHRCSSTAINTGKTATLQTECNCPKKDDCKHLEDGLCKKGQKQ